ncbi:MaoC family dehydratase [Chloroflexi bacterium]|nr:MaoC family dehydratase [Chloroflexota bacterium]
MPINYSILETGNTISDQKYTLTQKEIDLYLDSVQDGSERQFSESGIELAPPMAIAALSLRGVVNDLQIPGGTLHVGQEMQFKGSVEVGEDLRCIASIASNNIRGDWRFMTVNLSVLSSSENEILEGKSTIMLPAETEKE